tara:strand:- start:1142 stop:1861 length:720 start_codon:yes stop_codon:yes gene_type:complete
MNQELENLISLQNIDTKILDIESLAGDLPQKVEKKEIDLKEKTNELEISNNRIDELDKENRKLTSEIEDGQSSLAKYKEQLFLVKSNKEYDALNNEIDHLKQSISESENKYILLEEEKEALLKSKETNESAISELSESLQKEKAKLESALSESKADLEQLHNNRKAMENKIPSSYLSQYNTLKDVKGMGVAPLNGDCCGSCYSMLPPQMVVEIKSNNIIHFCPSCSVYAYWEKEVEEEI